MSSRLSVAPALAATTSLLLASAALAAVGSDSTALRHAVTLAGVRQHQQVFQEIAKKHKIGKVQTRGLGGRPATTPRWPM